MYWLDFLHHPWIMPGMFEEINSADDFEEINNADDVIDVLGGTFELARLFGANPRAVSNWRRRGLPPETYWQLKKALNDMGFDAPRALWKQREFAPESGE